MSSIDWSVFRQFARPAEPADENLFAFVAQGYTNSVLAEAVKRLSRASAEFEPICTALEGWMTEQRPLHEVWHASVSKLGRRIFEEGGDPWGEPLGRLLLDLAPTLPGFAYSFENTGGLPIVYDDRVWPAPGPISLTQEDNVLDCAGLGAAADGSVVSIADIGIIQTDQTAEALCEDGHPAIPLKFSKTGTYGWDVTLREGFDLLGQVSTYYETWVTRALKSIILIRQLPNQTMSGSWSDTSGVIYLSEPHSPLEACEVLIHECSHQYFHMADRVSSMRKASEKGLYFSPPVGRDRPLDMILIAYHAFANVLTFYERAFDMGLGNTTRTRNRYFGFAEDVAGLEEHLVASDGLSALGRAVFENVLTERRQAEPLASGRS